MATATGLLAFWCLAVGLVVLFVGLPNLGRLPLGTVPPHVIPLGLLAMALSISDASRPFPRSPFAPMLATCPNSPVTLSKPTRAGDALLVWPGMCEKWDCPHCGPIIAGRWNNVLGETIRRRVTEDGGPRVRHIVLTPDALHTTEEAWVMAQRGKTGFMEELQQRYGPLRYVWILSRQENGYPHMHIMVIGGCWMPHGQLQAGWGKRGGGRVWVHLAYDYPGLVRYLAGQLAGPLPDVVKRRWSTSRGETPLLYEPFNGGRKPAKGRTTLHGRPPKAVAREYERQGIRVILRE